MHVFIKEGQPAYGADLLNMLSVGTGLGAESLRSALWIRRQEAVVAMLVNQHIRYTSALLTLCSRASAFPQQGCLRAA